jgi:low affinity Fe/Cu permease
MEPCVISKYFSAFAAKVSELSGKPAAFVMATLLVVVWGMSGPVFHYSETWQLVINTGTTIITFLMVFILQNSQNRDSKAMQTKLDELILTSHANNKFAGIEKLDEEQLRQLSDRLSETARHANELANKRAKSASA